MKYRGTIKEVIPARPPSVRTRLVLTEVIDGASHDLGEVVFVGYGWTKWDYEASLRTPGETIELEGAERSEDANVPVIGHEIIPSEESGLAHSIPQEWR